MLDRIPAIKCALAAVRDVYPDITSDFDELAAWTVNALCDGGFVDRENESSAAHVVWRAFTNEVREPRPLPQQFAMTAVTALETALYLHPSDHATT